MSTVGDRDTATPIHTMGGVGIFAKEVQQAVLDGRADVAVHSAKDLPAVTPPGLVLAAIPERLDPRDALVGSRLVDLRRGAIVVDAHQRTSIAGLYAAGDVVIGLDQISHAMGEGGVAATTIRNDLAKRKPLRR